MDILFHYIPMAYTEKYTKYLLLFRLLNEYFDINFFYIWDHVI